MNFIGINSISTLIKRANELEQDNDMSIDDFTMPLTISAKVKKQMNRDLDPYNAYLEDIPIDEIMNTIRRYGYVVLQEDNTEWAGMLLGAEGNIYLHLGTNRKEDGSFEQVKNSMLALSWYKMSSEKYEIVTYIG